MRLIVVALVVALLSLTAIACEAEFGGFGVSVGPPAPSYPITLYQDGGAFTDEQVEFDDAKALGPLVVYYFNGTCEECVRELGLIQEAAQEHEGRLTALAVDIGPATGEGDTIDGKALLDEAGVTFPAGYTEDMSAVESHEIEAVPTVAFYGEGGLYRQKIVGFLGEDELREAIASILN